MSDGWLETKQRACAYVGCPASTRHRSTVGWLTIQHGDNAEHSRTFEPISPLEILDWFDEVHHRDGYTYERASRLRRAGLLVEPHTVMALVPLSFPTSLDYTVV